MTRCKLYHHSTLPALILLVCLFSILSLILTPLSAMVHGESSVRDEFLELYVEVARLGREGVDVSRVVKELSELHSVMERNDSVYVDVLLKQLRLEVENLKARAPTILFYKNAVKISTAILLAAIPIALYLLLPPLYLHIWFRTRRRWVVRNGSTR